MIHTNGYVLSYSHDHYPQSLSGVRGDLINRLKANQSWFSSSCVSCLSPLVNVALILERQQEPSSNKEMIM